MADGSMHPREIVPDSGNARHYRDALGHFATGVTVVTIMGPEGPMGFTASSFSSLSLDPPLVLWSPAKSARRFAHFAGAPHYAIHVLRRDQADWPARFARGGAGFEGIAWQRNAHGVPVLPQALVRFDCARRDAHDGGDHVIIVGQVLRLVLEEGEPLVAVRGRFGGFAG